MPPALSTFCRAQVLVLPFIFVADVGAHGERYPWPLRLPPPVGVPPSCLFLTSGRSGLSSFPESPAWRVSFFPRA